MEKSKYIGMSKWHLTIAIVAGALFASVGRFELPLDRQESQDDGPVSGSPRQNESFDDEPQIENISGRQTDSAEQEELALTVATGLVLRPIRTGNTFVGYSVVDADQDSRFQIGQVIVAINDVPVEDSAAGSELLVAALNDSSARISLLESNR